MIDQSKIFSRARTTAQTKARLKTTWRGRSCAARCVTLSIEKKREQRDGQHDVGDDHRREDQRLERRCPAPPRSPCRGQQRAEHAWRWRSTTTATISVFQRRVQDVRDCRPATTYHLIEKPDQTVGRPPSLKESSDQHGDRQVEKAEDQHEDRRAAAPGAALRSAITRPPCGSRARRRRDRRIAPARAAARIMMAISTMRQRRAERPVVGGQELVVDEIADHLELAAAEQRRRDEIADRQHEDEHRAGRDAGQRQRQGDAAGRCVNADAAEIARGLGEFRIQARQRRIAARG